MIVPVGMLAAAGVWLDRWSLVVDGISVAGVPYSPTPDEWGLLGGTVALFGAALLLFGAP